MGSACSSREVKGAIFEFEWKTVIFSFIPKDLRVEMHLIVDTAAAQSIDIQSLQDSCEQKPNTSRDDAKMLKTSGNGEVTKADGCSPIESKTETGKSTCSKSHKQHQNEKEAVTFRQNRKDGTYSFYWPNATVLTFCLLLLLPHPPGTSAQTAGNTTEMSFEVDKPVCLPSNTSKVIEWFYENDTLIHTQISGKGQPILKKFSCESCYLTSANDFCVPMPKSYHQGTYYRVFDPGSCLTESDCPDYSISLRLKQDGSGEQNQTVDGNTIQTNETRANETRTDERSLLSIPSIVGIAVIVCLVVGILGVVFCVYKWKKSLKLSYSPREHGEQDLNKTNNTELLEVIFQKSEDNEESHDNSGHNLLNGKTVLDP